MSPSAHDQTPSRRTEKIIGRKKPLAAIYNALKDEGRTWLLYFHGPGGIGKTRLLEDVATEEGKWRGLSFRCTDILDMYHSDYQSSDGIRHGIVAGLEEEESNDFREYYAKRKELIEKQTAGASSGELQRLQDETETAFLNDYRTLAQKHRLVIRLDTMELMQHESDPVQKICQVETVDALVMNWLVEQLPALPNTVILMAGRPQNRERIETTFTKRFHAKDNTFDAEELKAFSPEETSEYLNEISKKLKEQGDASLDEILGEYENLDAHCHRVAAGRPVYLALIVDLFLTQSEGSKQFVNDILAGREFPEDKLAEQLIDDLRRLPDPHGRIIQNLFRARKGLDAELLTYLGEEEKDIDSLLNWLEKLAIVKVRQAGDSQNSHKTFFFHDELYNMYDQYFRGAASESIEYQPFVEYYRQKLQDKSGPSPEKLAVDSLFYELRVNPYQGYHFHYAWQDHDAIQVHEHSYDMRLRNEVLGFLNRYVDPQSKFYDALIANRLDRDSVDRDCAVRWVRRHWARGDSQTAREVALDLIASEDPLFDWNKIDDDFYKADLLVALVEAAVQEAAHIKSAAAVLNQKLQLAFKDVPDFLEYAINILKAKGNQSSLDKAQQWHYHRISGAAHNRLGYFYRTTGRYGLALSHYQQAVAHFSRADVKSELTFALTNTAYLLGLNARPTEAFRLISRAIELNRESKRDYPLALALNTLGIIYTLDNHPNWGVKECHEALETVKAIGDDRGIGMALIGLGYSLRKQANQWKFGGISAKEANSIFQQAAKTLNEAVDIFSAFDEPIRLWEANNELGSLYCDWAWLMRSRLNDRSQALAYYDQSISYQEQARKLADEHDLESQTWDSLDDLAQAYGDRSTLNIEMDDIETARRDRQQAERYLIEVDGSIDAKFKLAVGGFDSETGEGEAQWVAMGKLHLWRGVWRFRDVEYKQAAEGETESRLKEAMANLFLSSIYFRQYWPTSFDYDRTMGYLTNYLPQLGDYLPRTQEPATWAKAQVESIETKYDIQLPELRNLIDRTVMF